MFFFFHLFFRPTTECLCGASDIRAMCFFVGVILFFSSPMICVLLLPFCVNSLPINCAVCNDVHHPLSEKKKTYTEVYVQLACCTTSGCSHVCVRTLCAVHMRRRPTVFYLSLEEFRHPFGSFSSALFPLQKEPKGVEGNKCHFIQLSRVGGGEIGRVGKIGQAKQKQPSQQRAEKRCTLPKHGQPMQVGQT